MSAIKNKFLLFLRTIVIGVMLAHALGSTHAVSVAHADPLPLPKVALLGSETGNRATDIVNKVTAAGVGLYTVTNLIGCPLATPSLATLQQYQAVMVWSDCAFSNPTTLGDVLADYVDGGGTLCSPRMCGGTVLIWQSQEDLPAVDTIRSPWEQAGSAAPPGH